MPKLFGVDIAQEIYSAFKGQLVPGTLIKRDAGTRTAGNLTGGTNPTETSYAFEGFIERVKAMNAEETLVNMTGKRVSIITNSLPTGILPETGDKISIEGTLYTITQIWDRDPAAALYELTVMAS